MRARVNSMSVRICSVSAISSAMPYLEDLICDTQVCRKMDRHHQSKEPPTPTIPESIAAAYANARILSPPFHAGPPARAPPTPTKAASPYACVRPLPRASGERDELRVAFAHARALRRGTTPAGHLGQVCCSANSWLHRRAYALHVGIVSEHHGHGSMHRCMHAQKKGKTPSQEAVAACSRAVCRRRSTHAAQKQRRPSQRSPFFTAFRHLACCGVLWCVLTSPLVLSQQQLILCHLPPQQ